MERKKQAVQKMQKKTQKNLKVILGLPQQEKKKGKGRKHSYFKNNKTSTRKHFLVLQFTQKLTVKGLIL